ncbi:hypothetical protein [Actinoallomurus sp. NPDC052274]|uniref:hypothetical protein n=1 Tax=Actinoallomurus sp. NPDC052274 TaxID=3155420 RepID=UPI0034203D14
MRRPSWHRLRAGAALVPAGVPATAHAAPVRTVTAKAPASVLALARHVLPRCL